MHNTIELHRRIAIALKHRLLTPMIFMVIYRVIIFPSHHVLLMTLIIKRLLPTFPLATQPLPLPRFIGQHLKLHRWDQSLFILSSISRSQENMLINQPRPCIVARDRWKVVRCNHQSRCPEELMP
jgi:hypothetical protein